MSTPLDVALHWADQGFWVFFVQPNKHPFPGSHGWEDARSNRAEIAAAYEALGPRGETACVACCPHLSGHAVLDIDVHEGSHGPETWEKLCQEHPELNAPTRTHRTPSGGYHLWFTGEVPSKAKLFSKDSGIDTRGVGGYVLMPGTGGYTVQADVECAPWPEFMAEAAHKSQVEAREATVSASDWDKPMAIEWGRLAIAREIERQGAPPRTGEGSDERAVKLCFRLLDFALRDDTVLHLLKEHWAPHFDRDWLATKLRNAHRYRENGAGCDVPQSGADLKAEIIVLYEARGELPPVRKPRFTRTSMAQHMARDPLKMWDAEGFWPMYPEGGVLVHFGPSGAHKSNVALHKSLDVLQAHPELKIAYCADEGGDGLGVRFRAQCRRRGMVEPYSVDRWSHIEVPFIMSEPDVDEFIAFCKRECFLPRIIHIDTLSTATRGAPEDEGLAALVTAQGNCGKLAAAFKALVILYAHTGWGDKTHVRGHSGLEANAAGVLMSRPTEPTSPSHTLLHAKHFRDCKDGQTEYYALLADSYETFPVPVPCTQFEYDMADKGSKAYAELDYQAMHGHLIALKALGPGNAKPTLDIAKLMFPQRGTMSNEVWEKACERVAHNLKTKLLSRFSGLWVVRDGDIYWSTSAAP